MTRWSASSALVAIALLAASPQGQQQGGGRGPDNFVPGELLVQFNQSMSSQQRDAALAARNIRRLRHFEELNIDWIQVPLPRNANINAVLATLRATPGVQLVQPNYIRRAIGVNTPNDPFWLDDSLWGIKKIAAPTVWTNYTTGNGTVVVADIDTGVDYTHSDLAANMWHNSLEIPGNGVDDDGNGYVDDVYGIDPVNGDSDPWDDHGHGTHTSGTIAAKGNNGIGVVGVNWNARILACKFLSASGSGTDAGAIECFNYIVALKHRGENIRVSSNSWGAPRGSGPPDTVLQAAIDAAGIAGILNVFGAGNDGTDNDITPFDPASYPIASIVAVASSGSTDRKSSFSNYGATTVDLAAPGENILSTYPFDQYQYNSGTSMATPHVSGAAALLLSMNPTLSVAALKSLLLDNVDKSQRWTGRVVSGGRLNVAKAADAIGSVPNNDPPQVALVAPLPGDTFKAPVNITLQAVASDPDGTVQSVTFYANGSPVGTDTTSPYEVTWLNVQPGSYTLTAVATDDLFGTGTSAPVSIFVADNTPPTVALTNPADGATFTSPAVVSIDATADDSDGVVQFVTFYANGQQIGTDTVAPFGISWNAPVGTHALTAVATDNAGATTTSAAVGITVLPIPGRVNVALAANGGVASASSTFSANYPPSGANNGDRKGLNWGAGGGWNDGTQNAGPDWLEVAFSGEKLIEEINVFSLQDQYTAPVEPTPTMTFTLWGLRAFEAQYWTGSEWATVPGAVVSTNNLVWRKFTFVPLATTKIRVFITGALNGYSRMIEVEAFGATTGVNVPPEVAITNPAAGASFEAPASFTVTAAAADSDGSVQQVEFFSNGALIGTDMAAPFTASLSNLAAGSYALTAVATDNQGAETTSATVTVTVTPPNVPPTVSMSAPADGATFTAPATIGLAADASDPDGTVASVAFYANGVLIGTDASSPFGVTWANAGSGAYALTAVATDDRGATTTSAQVNILVNQPAGRRNMALSSNGGVATASSTLSANYPPSGANNGDRKGLNWGAGGGWNDGTPNASPDWIEVAFSGLKAIDEIDVFTMQDNYTSPVEPTPSMTFTLWGIRTFDVQYWTGTEWATVPGGAVSNNNLVWRQFAFAPIVTSKVRVHITAALNGYSRVIEVEAWGVSAEGNAAPTVAIVTPAAGSSFTEPAVIGVSADASDSDGSVTSVAFFANGAPIGVATASPFSITWSNVSAGAYSLTAVATDDAGATTTSAPVSITVDAPNAPPTVVITNPAGGSSFATPASITVSADAADSDGSIAWVAFYANGEPIGTDATSPYSIIWAGMAPGAYTLTAVVLDNAGATTTSAEVSIVVNAAANRINVALAANGGVATASSTLGGNYPPASTINGDRKGLNWGAGGGWNDGTSFTSPDWLEVAFAGPKTIDEINVVTLQDSYNSPIEPTLSTTFTLWGIRVFQVQYWDGVTWVTVPGGDVTNNLNVWRQFLFSPVTTTRIRVFITGALNGYSRLVEVEAWGVPATSASQTTLASAVRQGPVDAVNQGFRQTTEPGIQVPVAWKPSKVNVFAILPKRFWN